MVKNRDIAYGPVSEEHPDRTSHERSAADTLFLPARQHYFDNKVYADVRDKIGEVAASVLARQTALFKGKEHQWNRRTYTHDYCNRSECGSYTYMNEGMFTGRMEPTQHNEWRVSDPWGEIVEALTIQISCRPHGKCDGEGDDACEGVFSSYLAAIRTADCDGITVCVDEVFDDLDDAIGRSNDMAEAECWVIAESNEKYQHEIRTEEIGEELVRIRRDVVKLIKSIKPIRCDIPSAIVMCVMDKISEMLSERRGLFRERNEMPDFN